MRKGCKNFQAIYLKSVHEYDGFLVQFKYCFYNAEIPTSSGEL